MIVLNCKTVIDCKSSLCVSVCVCEYRAQRSAGLQGVAGYPVSNCTDVCHTVILSYCHESSLDEDMDMAAPPMGCVAGHAARHHPGPSAILPSSLLRSTLP